MISITINGKKCEVSEGRTILQAAAENGIHIPKLCYMEGVSDIGMCRICMVEAEGYNQMLAACRTKVKEGMVINTESERLTAYRKEMLEMILANHNQDCMSCPANGTCELQNLCNEFGVEHSPYKGSRSCRYLTAILSLNITPANAYTASAASMSAIP